MTIIIAKTHNSENNNYIIKDEGIEVNYIDNS